MDAVLSSLGPITQTRNPLAPAKNGFIKTINVVTGRRSRVLGNGRREWPDGANPSCYAATARRQSTRLAICTSPMIIAPPFNHGRQSARARVQRNSCCYASPGIIAAYCKNGRPPDGSRATVTRLTRCRPGTGLNVIGLKHSGIDGYSWRQDHSAMRDLTNAFLLVYAALLPIVDPVGGAPIFVSLTRQCTDRERHALALNVANNGFFLLVGALFAGSYVLEFFGITLPVVCIGGGMAVAAFAWKLLNSDELLADQRAAGSAPVPPTDAFYPLTMPLTVGPGSIAVAITLGSQRPKAATDVVHLALLAGAAVAGIFAIAVTVYVCFRFAERIVAELGANGGRVLMRLSAFILLCIGIQIMWSGYSTLVGLTTLTR